MAGQPAGDAARGRVRRATGSGRSLDAQLRGLLGTLRLGHSPARALAVLDSRALVRSLFLASASSLGVLPFLSHPRALSEIAARTSCLRLDRLEAWLGVGVEIGELRRDGSRFSLRGVRARALASGDRVLDAHYRSMLEYQIGPYAELPSLLRDGPRDGRQDLEQYADDIAEVSLAASPFVAAAVRRVVGEQRPSRVLDVGCGTGVYARVVLEADPLAEVDGIDVASSVVERARQALDRPGWDSRLRLHVGDVREWVKGSDAHFDLVMLLNNVYYFDPDERGDLFRSLGQVLSHDGQLLVTTMVAAGSAAAAHLHFMLLAQAGAASLPQRAELRSELGAGGFTIVEDEQIVPGQPFVAVRAVVSPRRES